MYRFRNEYPYRRIPVRRIQPSNGGKASVYPSRQITETQPETTQTIEATQPAVSPIDDPFDGTSSIPGSNWQATATRLQADMENFRKRQMRRAEEAITAERERLLTLILPVADNLMRALAQERQEDEALRQGVALTYHELMRRLEAEGITRLETVGHAFDPNFHEAISTRPDEEIEPNTVIEEVEAGYLLGDKLLRPAKVVVAA